MTPDAPKTPPGMDVIWPSPARTYDYFLGGRDNYAVDRQTADSILRMAPEIRDLALQNRAFLRRCVTHLTRDLGIDQFLDIGSGLPTADNVHEIALRSDPAARVVYVDSDPVVHLHSRALLKGAGSTGFLLADAREPETILTAPETRRLIDFGRPTAVLLVGVLDFIPDDDDPAAIVTAIAGHLPTGSHFVIVHATSDDAPPQLVERVTALYRGAAAQPHPRTRTAVQALFTGLDLLEPGLVDVQDWRPEKKVPIGTWRALAGVARIS
ncbi:MULTISPECIES: SAM-dependent methyltransferase [Thermomonosporaceae]|uniref:SAM-dependent methyltransferase n=1 Tax=Thermomonosporaceae TaxID=2012 RepID=UPI00255ADFD6|nr:MULTISPECIES: SAM-dependent methyltransferase [Thermomonosporaceae]MDL4776617.1 SAM-dependent methyltransferase [Actinomadura xylanilytica]